MANFLSFIEEDIDAKKTLLSSMPTGTKTAIRKYNEKVDSIEAKYIDYRSLVKKYLDAKAKAFSVQETHSNDELKENVRKLEDIRFFLNPRNTYWEKLGFDTLFYQIRNYHDFKFKTLNEIINAFLDKFASLGVNLTKDDFDYTVYVHEFMTAYLSAKSTGSENGEAVAEKFEKIYWTNSELVLHIEINFRKLIKKNEKRFIEHFKKQQIEMSAGQMTYDACVSKLKEAYRTLSDQSKENIVDIIELAKAGELDIKNFYKDSKTRETAFETSFVDQIDMNDKYVLEKFYEDLRKLRNNLEEYRNYIKFLPLINNFKNEYLKDSRAFDIKGATKNLKEMNAQIVKEEKKLEKLNKQANKTGAFAPSDKAKKELIHQTVKHANNIYELYMKQDYDFFNNTVMTAISTNFTVSDLLNLFYSYDFFKKMAIKVAFNTTDYDEISKIAHDFDVFAINPHNVIISGINLTEDNNVAKIIVNKYRPYNINVTEEDLAPDNVDSFIERVDYLLRVDVIEKSTITMDKIWFIAEVARINNQTSN